MTTIAMVAGMVPSALGLGDGGEFRAPMAIGVIGGLVVSTLLSLVFVPSFYTVMDDLSRWAGRRSGGCSPHGMRRCRGAHGRSRRLRCSSRRSRRQRPVLLVVRRVVVRRAGVRAGSGRAPSSVWPAAGRGRGHVDGHLHGGVLGP